MEMKGDKGEERRKMRIIRIIRKEKKDDRQEESMAKYINLGKFLSFSRTIDSRITSHFSRVLYIFRKLICRANF